MHQGNAIEGPLFAITRRAIDATGQVSLVARSYLWWLDLFGDGHFSADEGALSTPTGLASIGTGLTALQLCVNDYYGDCGASQPTQHPQIYFFASWPNSPNLGVSGLKFEHLQP